MATARTTKPSQDPEVLTVEGDIADPATAGRITRAALDRFGRILHIDGGHAGPVG